MLETVKTRGYASPSAFVRAAIHKETSGGADSTEFEERVSAGFDRIAQEIFGLARSQQALFALVDALTKTVLTCDPEPPSDVRPQAVARGRERYNRLIKTAGKSMNADAKIAMQELVSRKNDEKDFRLHPRKPLVPRARNDRAVWATAFKFILHYPSKSRKAAQGGIGPRGRGALRLEDFMVDPTKEFLRMARTMSVEI